MKMESKDAPEKIAEFYRKALSKYGTVLIARILREGGDKDRPDPQTGWNATTINREGRAGVPSGDEGETATSWQSNRMGKGAFSSCVPGSAQRR